MNEDKLTAQEVMQETGWTFCKDNEEATRKETEAAVDYVLNLYHQQLQAHNEWLDKTAWVQDMVTISELGEHRADLIRKRIEQADAREKYLSEQLEQKDKEVDRLNNVINKLVAQNPSESLISLLWGRTKL